MRRYLLIAIVMLAVSACGLGQPKLEPEIHLIPAGYEGPVKIEFMPDGVPLEREGRARVYRVNADGRARINAKPNLGVGPTSAMQWFYVDQAGKRTAIPTQFNGCGGPHAVVVHQVSIGSGSEGPGTPMVSYQAYYVGPPDRCPPGQ